MAPRFPVSTTYNLAAVAPHLTADWHPTRNGDLTPLDVTPRSGRRVWWRCRRGHEWCATPDSRVGRGTGCPYCTHQTTRPELRIFSELQCIFPDVQHRARIAGLECDILLPSDKIVIQYDGSYYHRDVAERDARLTARIEQVGYCVVRLRYHGLPAIPVGITLTISTARDLTLTIMKDLVRLLGSLLPEGHGAKPQIAQYLTRRDFYLPGDLHLVTAAAPKRKSLADTHPDLAAEWHPERNGRVTPYDLMAGSEMRVWWKCEKAHEWCVSPNQRTCRGAGCPFCAGRRVDHTNNFLVLHPDLASSWHPTLNGDLDPKTITAGTARKVWWCCPKGHEWCMAVNKRTAGQGCPVCAGKRPDETNNFAVRHPDLVAEWHPTRNGDLKPETLLPGSARKIWWRCSEGHEWCARLYSRTLGGHGCRTCSRLRGDRHEA